MSDKTQSSTIHLPQLDPAVIQACSFQNWYKLFSIHTFRSTIIPLDQCVVDYLENCNHGLHLPQELTSFSNYTSQLSHGSDSEDESEIQKNSPAGSSSSRSSSPLQQYHFPELTAKIAETIKLYDGSVFPKLNWSAPQDASFLLVSGDGPLRCRNPTDVYTVLKGSDCIFHDLDLIKKVYQMLPQTKSNLSVVLVLREWFNLNPASEFRCFVRDKKLIAITSRSSTHYEFLSPREVQQSISIRICSFFKTVITPQFTLPDFIFDVYLKNPTKLILPSISPVHHNLKLIDINPFASYIDPCLFSYDELDEYREITAADQATSPIIRCVGLEHPASNFRPSKFQTCKVPRELVEFAQNQQDINHLCKEFQKLSDSETK